MFKFSTKKRLRMKLWAYKILLTYSEDTFQNLLQYGLKQEVF